MSGNNSALYLSEGTCYFGQGAKADPNFIPCGNANLEGPQACCYKGDYCLSSNTCWDAETIVTYIAGCTDSTFQASTCPQRQTHNYPDQQWIALARCNGADIDLWSGCAHHPELIQIEKENCDCNMSNILIQNPNGKDSFDEIGLLPNATGDPIAFNPTVVPSAIATSSGGDGGLSTGAKAGIGVGVSIFGLLVIAALAFFILRRRRQRQSQVTGPKSELDGYVAREKTELDTQGREIREMDSPDAQRQRAAELDSSHHGTSHGGGSTAYGSSEPSNTTAVNSVTSPSDVSSPEGSTQQPRRFY
jgi:hypothetical protein